jgi:hypothetical protein
MNIYIRTYIFFWLVSTLIWVILLIKERKNIILLKKDYVLFLFKKWKVTTFLIATISLNYISTLWYDPTWDIPETIIMSILTFYFSPYSAWIFYRYYKWINKSKIELFISIILMFFSSCWFYDVYVMIFLLWYYPETAFVNISLSPYFYIFAWIMWNLDYSKKDWVIFIFTKKEWINFKCEKWNFWKIFFYTLPFIIFMTIVFWFFIYLNI